MRGRAVPRPRRVLYFSPMSRARRTAWPATVSALLAALLADRPAAADEGESALSVGAVFSTFTIDEYDGPGGGLSFDYERGLSDAFWLRLSATAAVHDGGDGAIYTPQATIGLTYVIDVLKYVPYLHAGLGVVQLVGSELDAEYHPLAEIGIGLDLLVSRERSYGFFARAGTYLEDSAFITAGVRMTWRWGFF
jgi:hypothetical protein